MPHPVRPCPGCASSRVAQRTTCMWCGFALRAGRQASAQEQYETSEAARLARAEAVEAARRSPVQIDRIVAEAIGQHFKVLDEFTHDYLVRFTSINACAIKHALIRLSRKGVVRPTGLARVRSNRTRQIWQVLVPSPGSEGGTGGGGLPAGMAHAALAAVGSDC